MTKKENQDFFKSIRSGDVDKVRNLISSNFDYVNACSLTSPKKDDGQSGLQVAFKIGNFEIAKLLIERGANVNFMELSEINEWTAPVLHDCIRATIFNSYAFQKDTSEFESGLQLLSMMINKEANPNEVDSYGNNSLHRAILDSKEAVNHSEADLKNGILISQLKNVFTVLLAAGADPKKGNEERPSPETLMTTFGLNDYRLF